MKATDPMTPTELFEKLLISLDYITRCAHTSGPAGTTMYFVNKERMDEARVLTERLKELLRPPLQSMPPGGCKTVTASCAIEITVPADVHDHTVEGITLSMDTRLIRVDDKIGRPIPNAVVKGYCTGEVV